MDTAEDFFSQTVRKRREWPDWKEMNGHLKETLFFFSCPYSFYMCLFTCYPSDILLLTITISRVLFSLKEKFLMTLAKYVIMAVLFFPKERLYCYEFFLCILYIYIYI